MKKNRKIGIEFYKTEAGANDFVVLMGFEKPYNHQRLPSIARRVCSRSDSVGADGLILVERSKEADVRMIYFNSDGSRAALCGNGLRTVALLVNKLGMFGKNVTIETDSGVSNLTIKKGNIVRNTFLPPRIISENQSVTDVDGYSWSGVFLDVGIPYFCVPLKDISGFENFRVVRVGKFLRRHKSFGTEGTNVTFFVPLAPDEIKIRIYERGVEDETLSSGTGAYSSAIAAALMNLTNPPVKVKSPGGYVFVGFDKASGYADPWLEGPARIVFNGELWDF